MLMYFVHYDIDMKYIDSYLIHYMYVISYIYIYPLLLGNRG